MRRLLHLALIRARRFGSCSPGRAAAGADGAAQPPSPRSRRLPRWRRWAGASGARGGAVRAGGGRCTGRCRCCAHEVLGGVAPGSRGGCLELRPGHRPRRRAWRRVLPGADQARGAHRPPARGGRRRRAGGHQPAAWRRLHSHCSARSSPRPHSMRCWRRRARRAGARAGDRSARRAVAGALPAAPRRGASLLSASDIESYTHVSAALQVRARLCCIPAAPTLNQRFGITSSTRCSSATTRAPTGAMRAARAGWRRAGDARRLRHLQGVSSRAAREGARRAPEALPRTSGARAVRATSGSSEEVHVPPRAAQAARPRRPRRPRGGRRL